MEDKALAYLKTPIGEYALTSPLNKKYPEPKPFLVRMSPEAVEKHKKELKDALVRCVKTKTGARFCIFRFDNKELEGMEMCRPIFEFKKIIETKEPPTIEECRKLKKNDFLIVKEKNAS